jgi:hypothetical protein
MAVTGTVASPKWSLNMVNMRALIDDRRYFDRIQYYYRMFSYDLTYYTDEILIEPAKITRISTRSISALLQALLQHGQRGERHFLIATHGNPNGLPIRIRPDNAATMNSDVMDDLNKALSGNAATRQAGRLGAMGYEANGVRVFQNEQQLDDLLGWLRRVRQLQLEHLEFRGCNIGAGPALRSVHNLLGAKLTAAPTVQFMWARISTATYRPISADQFAQQQARLSPNRRTFTRVDCYRASSPGNDQDVVVALGLEGDTLRLIARDTDMIKGWTQAYLQESTLFAVGQEPPGGGYRPGGYLPMVGFLTPNGQYPFVVPGDSFDYTQHLACEMQPPQWVP